ncbi:hypothetical protein VHEMI09104 [[Torrubiella] hemipterigena]|uniref:Uncharacterized protein n=1 Tax=[Torrubiella] hemipterigena TaxID=1531966 RepID=A0A0A1TPQ0_9HYPO|nr:hypothetical protein VHEMI09104 [[Torrubiella] hemipterigena]
MYLRSLLFTESKPAHNTDDLTNLLVAVLPTFIGVAKRAWDQIPDRQEGEPIEIVTRRDFYQNFYAKAFSLFALLSRHDIDPGNSDTTSLSNLLLKLLDMLENAFISWKDPSAIVVCSQLGLDRRPTDLYPKLYALWRIVPDDGIEVNESVAKSLGIIIQVYSRKAEKRRNILNNLVALFSHLDSAQSYLDQQNSECPLRFDNYPIKNLRRFLATLFLVLEKSWRCKCESIAHSSRAIKLNLTQHRRFETRPLDGQHVLQNKALFRVMFPTSFGPPRWQNTDITVKHIDERGKHEEVKDNLCRIIEEAKASVIPRMAVFDSRLWQLRSQVDKSGCFKVPDNEFISLRDLFIGPHWKVSSMNIRERIILSFIIVTTFLHFVTTNQPWLQSSLTADNICFRVSQRTVNITQPYLNIRFIHTPSTAAREKGLNNPHPWPEILSLGSLLLELARGETIQYTDFNDKCAETLVVYDRWSSMSGSSISPDIPEALFQAIFACIEPTQLELRGLCKTIVRDSEIRSYIFERVLYPLGDTLDTIYDTPLQMLHADAMQSSTASNINTQPAAILSEKKLAGKEWRQRLDRVHDTLYHPRLKALSKLNQDQHAVKIAVLDTGLQLTECLQESYKAEGRLAAAMSFCQDPDWDVDHDGHGTCVAKLVLDVASRVKLHVAKVIQHRSDLANPKVVEDVYKNIANAIEHATNTWNVDIIIMSYGFEKPVPTINAAMERAIHSDCSPLFFAATQNSGAHVGMAWPAREPFVFGISSTDGLGAPSPFNPEENYSHPIFYAFGEDVQIKGIHPNVSAESTTFVSGTSFATPIAAALAANVLAYARLADLAASERGETQYWDVPRALRRMNGMLKVMMHCMRRKHQSNTWSLLPWEFMDASRVDDDAILKDIHVVLSTL